jgi:hypothetical protein
MRYQCINDIKEKYLWKKAYQHIPKLHETPHKDSLLVKKNVPQNLSILLTKILTAVKERLHMYCATVYARSGVNQMWILKNSKELLENLKSPIFSQIYSIKTYDFTTVTTH